MCFQGFLVLPSYTHTWGKLHREHKLTFDGQHSVGKAAAGGAGRHAAVLAVVSRYSISNGEHRPIRTNFYIVYEETGDFSETLHMLYNNA